MGKIIGKELEKIGFIKEHGDTFHYYVYETNKNHQGLLISCANDEKINDSYTIEFYGHEDIKIYDINDVKSIIEIINKNK